MEKLNVFLSVGGTATEAQERFVQAIEHRLGSEGLTPKTVGRNTFSSDSPLKAVKELMNECSGAVIIALERTYFPQGLEKRGGSNETELKEVKYATPWNQIEAAMAYSKEQPLMIIIEEGVKSEGLLEKGHDWYVMKVKPEASSLATAEFNGVLSSWKKKVASFNTNRSYSKAKANPAELIFEKLVKSLKMLRLWAILAALAGLVTGAFALG